MYYLYTLVVIVMKIYLYLTEKIVSFTLPQEIMGSYSFDEDPEEEIKLINIEAREEEWVLYSTSDVNIINNTNEIIKIKEKYEELSALRAKVGPDVPIK